MIDGEKQLVRLFFEPLSMEILNWRNETFRLAPVKKSLLLSSFAAHFNWKEKKFLAKVISRFQTYQ